MLMLPTIYGEAIFLSAINQLWRPSWAVLTPVVDINQLLSESLHKISHSSEILLTVLANEHNGKNTITPLLPLAVDDMLS